MKKANLLPLFSLLILLLIVSCRHSVTYRITKHYPQRFTPPGTVRISDSLFYDACEMRNQDWQEYLFWLAKVYQPESEEYRNASSFSNTWSDLYPLSDQVNSLKRYFTYPEYRGFPILSLTQEEAKKYCNWRSDRVFEVILVHFKIIEYDTAQTPSTHFTIERFFTGKIKKLKEIDIFYYPEYSLPTYEEYEIAVEYSERFSDSCKRCRKIPSFPDRHYHLEIAEGDTLKTVPLTYCYNDYGMPISHIRGNVSEWLNEPNLTAGGSWRDYAETILENDTSYAYEPSPCIGFRCVCKIRKWEPKN